MLKTKYDYYITLDNEDGTKEIVKQIIGSFEDADNAFNDVIIIQSEKYHKLKMLKKWRVVRLFDKDDNQIRQES